MCTFYWKHARKPKHKGSCVFEDAHLNEELCLQCLQFNLYAVGTHMQWQALDWRHVDNSIKLREEAIRLSHHSPV